MAQQGTSPITDVSVLHGDVWPDEENVEDFIATYREWRGHKRAEPVSGDDQDMPKTPAANRFLLVIDYHREEDGRWLADVPALPGVTAYGLTKEQATVAVQAMALRRIAALMPVETAQPQQGPEPRDFPNELLRRTATESADQGIGPHAANGGPPS